MVEVNQQLLLLLKGVEFSLSTFKNVKKESVVFISDFYSERLLSVRESHDCNSNGEPALDVVALFGLGSHRDFHYLFVVRHSFVC